MTDTTARPMRADARRNAELLIATARAVFAEKGHTAPLDEIARRAGVGPGTLYRHFPNRDLLIQAVYRSDLDELAERAHELLATLPANQALDAWMREHLRFVRYKRGLTASLGAALVLDDETAAHCRQVLTDGAEALLTAARGVGAVRDDVEPFDLLRLGHGIGVAAEHGTEDDGERMLRIMLDGLRALPGGVR